MNGEPTPAPEDHAAAQWYLDHAEEYISPRFAMDVAFARHRIAAEAKTREEDARVADECMVLLTIGATCKMHGRECREQIATAIRSRIPEIGLPAPAK